MKYFTLLFFTTLLLACHTEEISQVDIDVTIHTKDEHTSPLYVKIENNSRNAGEFKWIFEGGEPATSSKKSPETIIFNTPGLHTITLEAWNDGDRQDKTFTVRVDSAVVLDFDITAEVNNFAPARFVINNKSTGGNKYLWHFEGGSPDSFEGKNPSEITYSAPGTYTVSLETSNGSENFKLEKEIEVKESLWGSFIVPPKEKNAGVQ